METVFHPASELERTNLEAHVDLCYSRYMQLENRLTKIEDAVETIHNDIIEGQKSLVKVLIGTAGTVIAGMMSTIVVLLVNF